MNDPGVQWRRVTVVGCGLIGASFALALRRAVPHVRISGWDASPLALNEALQRGAIDDVDTSFSNRSVLTSELIYLAMPVAQIIAFLRDYGPGIPANTIVTDAGSTKLEICQAAQQHLSSGSEFIGGHPIAGSHLTGPLHARAELFETAAYVLTPERESEALESLAHIVRKLGACVRQMDALEHDRAMAIVSHLPQLISSALAATVNHRDDAAALEQLCGAGYRDMTRLASSSWSVWRDILASNSGPIADALNEYIETLASVRDELRREESNANSQLSEAQTLFNRLEGPP